MRRSETDGHFALPPQKENYALLALTDTGSILAPRPRRDIQGEATLRLQPWARVSGSVMFDGKPAVNLVLQSYDPEESTLIENEPRLRLSEVHQDRC